jgi:predicted protein tyrosine phosphatase
VIIVSPLCHVERLAAKHIFSRSLSLLAPAQVSSFKADVLPRENLLLAFNDVLGPGPGLVAPDERLAGAVIAFGRACAPGDTILVHCWMGVSRSPAAAYVIACARAPGAERAIAQELRRRSPVATPNRLLVALADDLLARNGRMVDSIDAIGRGRDLFGDAPAFALPLDWSGEDGI